MLKTKNKIFKLIVLIALLPLLGLGCKGSGTISRESLTPVTLEYWRTFDEADDFTEVVAAFRAQYPHITLNIKKVRIEDYEQSLLRAIAEGKGPDIVSLHNTWLRQYQDALAPLPENITLPVTEVDGKNTATVLKTKLSLSLREMRNNFVDVVVADSLIDGKIYGLPLALDAMVLYYNRTLLNQANIPTPPATWSEFKEAVKALIVQDRSGNFVQAGVSLGTSRNINRSPDLLAALMMQNGTEMANANNTRATFDLVPAAIKDKSINPGRDALTFYTDFASPAKEVYTWNDKMPESLNAFASAKSAMFFGYAYHLPLIRSLAPGLDLGIAKLPQISSSSKPVNFANYWTEAVTKQSRHPNEAWAFIQFAASAENVKSFLTRAKKPTALRALIAEQRQDDILITWADQILTAQSWYRGKNPGAAEEALRVMIDQVIKGEYPSLEAIKLGVEKINETF